MQYEEIESYIKTDRPDIWRRLYPLHGFYKNEITRITAENCVFLACYDEAEQVAREVIAWVETQPDELVSGFDLLSQFHAELKELRRITGRIFTRKANRLRRNLRRVIGLHPEDDEVQQDFDNARTASAKSFIIIPDAEHPERSLSAHDLHQFHLRKSYAVNLAIADGIHDLAVDFLNHAGLFLTLTLPGEYRNCSYEQAKTEISRRWKRVRRKARDKNVLLLGMTALELHEDETPHYHIQLYVSPEHRAWVEEQILDAFPNECDRRDEAIKDIRDVARASRYTTKDHGKPETSLTFIGLRKDIKRRYRGVYEGKDTSALSEWRVSRARQLMKQKTSGGAVLLLLRGFADERLNRLSARHPDFHYAESDIQRLQTMFLHTLHFRVVKDFRETDSSQASMISKAPKQENTASCFGPVPTCLYKNQEGVRACGLPCECMGSLGQPPPVKRWNSHAGLYESHTLWTSIKSRILQFRNEQHLTVVHYHFDTNLIKKKTTDQRRVIHGSLYNIIFFSYNIDYGYNNKDICKNLGQHYKIIRIYIQLVFLPDDIRLLFGENIVMVTRQRRHTKQIW